MEEERRAHFIADAVTVSAGMVVFALFSHQGLPWSAIAASGLLLTAFTMGRRLRRARRPLALLGLVHPSRKAALISVLGVALGAGAGLLYLEGLGHSEWTGGVEAFVLVACLIGATEELVYRGWLQGVVRPLGWGAAVTIAATAHAVYKTALFVWPHQPMGIDLAAIGLWTVAGGVVIGLMREVSGSVVPSMVAHVVFDFVVYGGVANAPWWVWT